MDTDRDIELVMVTGAGASCSFGVRQRLPLMGDWVNELVQRLGEKGMGFVQATGLKRDMEPQQFEAQLGAFLRSVQAFDRIQSLLGPITEFPGSPGAFLPADQWNQWHRAASFQLSQIVGVIHESLYALFADQSVDTRAAARAYAGLFAEIGLPVTTGWVCATTNYDTLAEGAISELGGLPDAGDVQPSLLSPERDIRVDGLIAGMPRYVPVLHLHGRAGWFRREDGRAYAVPAQAYNQSLGIPIVMLPDLQKDYATDPIISSLWSEFGQALARAKRVLVLGHSLHDDALLTALASNITPQRRVAVTVLASETDPSQPANAEAASVRGRVLERLPEAQVIPLRFTSDFEASETGIRRWSEDAAQL
jgi:hypothetical protein